MEKNSKIIAILIGIFVILLAGVIYDSYFLKSTEPGLPSGGAVQSELSLSVTLISSENNLPIPASGQVNFSGYVKGRITKIDNLSQSNGTINVTLWGAGWYSTFGIPQPNSSQAGNLTIEYFEIKSNYSVSHSRLIYFSVAQSELGTVSPKNISLLVYKTDTNWTSLPTYMVNSSADPATFYAVATNFSFFLITQKPAGAAENENAGEEEEAEEPSPSPSPSPSPGTPSGGGGGGGGGGSAISTGTPISEGPRVAAAQRIKVIHKASELFDVIVTIPEKYQLLSPGSELPVEIKLINLYRAEPLTLNLQFTIEDQQGSRYYTETGTETVEQESNFIQRVKLPEDLAPGLYIFYLRAQHEEHEAIGGAAFEIAVPSAPGLAGVSALFPAPLQTLEMIVGLVLLFALLTLLALWYRRRKSRRTDSIPFPINKNKPKIKW